jgi:hypothetical protein
MSDGYPTLTADPQRDKGAGIVCRICGAEEGVFIVLRSRSETTYECEGCADQRPLSEAPPWLRAMLRAPPWNAPKGMATPSATPP